MKPSGKPPHALCRTLLLCLFLWATLLPAPVAATADTWLLIDSAERTLQVMDGEQVVRRFENIAIGSNGAAGRRVLGDRQTPLGTFRISSIRKETRYHRFFGINFPALDDAMRAHVSDKIDDAELAAIRRAHELGEEPPSSTPLGGNIGIHGLGTGDPRVHEDFNWTDGCIALTNEQVDELAQWVRLRMTVVIL
ncbi:MAG: L,D-transpeptidase family protein [Lysobacterales bacterium]